MTPDVVPLRVHKCTSSETHRQGSWRYHLALCVSKARCCLGQQHMSGAELATMPSVHFCALVPSAATYVHCAHRSPGFRSHFREPPRFRVNGSQTRETCAHRRSRKACVVRARAGKINVGIVRQLHQLRATYVCRSERVVSLWQAPRTRSEADLHKTT